MFPDDTVRLLFSCMICNTLDNTTIRMKYAFGEAEVNCFCCGHQWKTKVTRSRRQQGTVYQKWQDMIKKKIGVRTRPPPIYCENCGVYHEAPETERRERAAASSYRAVMERAERAAAARLI